MTGVPLSTTADGESLARARAAHAGAADAALIDEALKAILDRYPKAEVDTSYAAYDEHPLAEPDAWGDLETFRQAAASS